MALPILIALVVFSVVILWLFFYYVPLGLWITAIFSGVPIGIGALIGMRLRKVPPTVIVNAMISATKAGLTVNRDALEAHYLAGGSVQNVTFALISADKANIPLDFKMATAIDLAGRDVLQAVQMSVNPKVIDTPPVTAVAKDGIQLIAKARITVRANIAQLVGGAGEDTILARVGEGVVSSIGSAESHKKVLENPDSISKVVLARGLDSGTAFEILSVALEQEMKAKAQEARANVIEAEVQIPQAMAEAFRAGHLGIMDYYKFDNIKADTDMRNSIAKPGDKGSGKTSK